jgi:hypothetical protein
MINYLKIAAILAFTAVIFAGGFKVADWRDQAKIDKIQHAWDTDKADIAALAANQAAENARKLSETQTNNEGITHDLQNQVDTLRGLNSDLAQRLRSVHTDSPTGRGVVSKIDPHAGLTTAATDDRLGQIDDAIAATLTECAVNRSHYAALIAEIKPQLGAMLP